MSDEQDKLRASLEAPKLFGRKKKAGARPAPAESEALGESAAEPTSATADETPEPTAVLETVDVEATTLTSDTVPPTPEPDPIPEPEPAPVPEPEPVPQPEPIHAARPEPAPEPATEPESVPEPEREPAPVVEAEPVPEPIASGEPEPEPAASALAARASMAGPVAAAPSTAARTSAGSSQHVPLPPKASEKAATGRSKGRRALDTASNVASMLRKPVTAADEDAVPLLAPYPAAAATGLIVGAVMVLLTWLSLRGCSAVRGTASCGGGPGFILLIIIFTLSVYLGSALLKACVISDPGSTSFLAVGLVAVISLMVLIQHIDSWTMIVIIPVLTILSYLASVWITKNFAEERSG